MDEGQGQAGEVMNHAQENRTTEDVRAEIEQTRAELGDTVEALAAKTDVKSQAKRAATNARTTVSDKAAEARHAVLGKKQDAVTAAQEAAPASAGEAGRRISRLVQENRAMLIPASALVLGMVIGRRRVR
ncbi:MAG TPA: DUF3618 domain-containing protein [Solirubrobacteraceae bacterium]|jgi:ElaB/YqjD/DUF883 family membrane-anchored ribosome-binding protein|nr:DUF3618 domain-containing protein [Solirubrobacteraceae bacterium]